MLKKIKSWLFPTSYDGFTYDAVDGDGDGILQEGTKFERKVVVTKKPVKKAVAKKVAKKAPVKKKPVAKKVAKKAPAKKTAKKKK